MRKTILVLALACTTPQAFPCAPAPRANERVSVVEESAVIIWDPSTKTEHFIRRATFRGDAHDFGFLVPTPTAPKLEAVDDGIFDTLQETTARKTVHTKRKAIDWTPAVALFFASRNKGEGAGVTARPPVEVLDVQKVAGYEASILDATDAAALNTWLQEHEYATTPDLTEWLDAYIKQQWKITAFKIDKQAGYAARSSAVKMSFTTEGPFFPYREPASSRESADTGRILKIWFLGPERVTGSVAGGESNWPHDMIWSAPLDAALLAKIPGATASTARLTAFVDESTPRPGIDDLFFSRAADQRTMIPPPNVIEEVDTTHVPLDLVLLPLVVIAFMIWRRRR